MKYLIVALLFASTANADDNCLKGCPIGAPEDNKKIEREIYTLQTGGGVGWGVRLIKRVTIWAGP